MGWLVGHEPFRHGDPHVDVFPLGGVTEGLEQDPGSGRVGVVGARGVCVEGLEDAERRARRHVGQVSERTALHREDERRANPPPPVRRVNVAV